MDAVHVDAAWPGLLQRLQEALPDIVLGSEAVLSFSEMGLWGFSRNAVLGLVDPRRRPKEQGGLPLATGVEALYAWLDKPSPVCAFAYSQIDFISHTSSAAIFTLPSPKTPTPRLFASEG